MSRECRRYPGVPPCPGGAAVPRGCRRVLSCLFVCLSFLLYSCFWFIHVRHSFSVFCYVAFLFKIQIYMFVCLSLCFSVCLPVCLYVCMPVVCLFVCVCLSGCLVVYMVVTRSVYFSDLIKKCLIFIVCYPVCFSICFPFFMSACVLGCVYNSPDCMSV